MREFHQKLLRNDEYLMDFFEHAPVGFHSFGPDQRIIDINQTELDMIGYERTEIVGKKRWSDLIVAAQIKRFHKHWRDINKIGFVKNLSYTLKAKDGNLVEVLLNASARYREDGKLLNTRGSVLDVTKMRKMQKRLKEQRDVLKKNYGIVKRLSREFEQKHEEIKSCVVSNLEMFVLPLLSKLKRRGDRLDMKTIELLETNLRHLPERFGSKIIDNKWQLSSREIDICHLIKNGLTTKEIADFLCTSVRTVDNHRNHIRKKLGISLREVDLSKYLQAL